MSNDDTFFGIGGAGGDDRTVLRPTPGGRGRQGQAPASRPSAPPPRGSASVSASAAALQRTDASDVNPLAGAAAPLLALAARLRGTLHHPDPAGLFRQVAQEIKSFEAAAHAAGARNEHVLTARYALCTLLDEAVLNTPWGSQSVWASQTLLNLFHNEGWGGEKFFQILDRLLPQAAANIDLLELMYLCMAMGLQGKYRVQSGGRGQLEAVEANVLQVLRQHRGEPERELSPRWRGVEDARPKLARFVPLWVVAAVGAGIALAVYAGLLMALNRASDPVAVQVAALGRDVEPLEQRRAAVAPQRTTLAELLRAQIDRHALEVRNDSGAESVVLREGLFASGSADVEPSAAPLLEAVGQALDKLPGPVLVTGHTDDVPIRTLRFPSNWQLSKKRAEAVRDILARTIGADRLTAEGRADTEPLVANDTSEHRALNRRVEIKLLSRPSIE
ncbi:MAG TPA: type IVB secretion system protein IcmH/DotU [Gammaproteobacteria bacterium]|nr:type IVB secretion system protein IcmH/DotU [Gammaproteobacteria bacterium]